MQDIFIKVAMNANQYEFWCDGKIKQYTADMHTEYENGKYLVVRCEECCNIPVFHLLYKRE